MKPGDLLLHCYFEKDGDQWLAFCLDFTLVAQARTLEEAAEKLRHQMLEYVHDATVGEDRPHAAYLLRRRAPMNYWFKFYWTTFKQVVRHKQSKRRMAEREAMPLAPVCA
ncbi:MAG: hypothetical protein QM769_01895 [Pseudoxanthomonas sp.]